MTKKTRIATCLLTACLALQIVLVSLPASSVARIRNGFRWIGRPIDWLEANLPYISVIHLLSFFLIGLISYFIFSRTGYPRLFGVLLAFAALTELLQLLVPGRSPGMVDFTSNLLGILIGFGIGFIVSRIGFWHNSSTDSVTD